MDTIKQTFNAWFYLKGSWIEPDLKEKKIQDAFKKFEGQTVKTGETWPKDILDPQIQFMNEAYEPTKCPKRSSKLPSGGKGRMGR